MSFREYLANLRSLWGLLAITILASPLVLWPAQYYPPWPEDAAPLVVVVGVIIGLVGLVVPMLISPRHRLTKKAAGGAFCLAGVLLAIIYILYFGSVVVNINQRVASDLSQSEERESAEQVDRIFLVGTELLPNRPANVSVEKLLMDFGKSTSVWTRASLDRRGIVLLAVFYSMLFCLITGFGYVASAAENMHGELA